MYLLTHPEILSPQPFSEKNFLCAIIGIMCRVFYLQLDP